MLAVFVWLNESAHHPSNLFLGSFPRSRWFTRSERSLDERTAGRIRIFFIVSLSDRIQSRREPRYLRARTSFVAPRRRVEGIAKRGRASRRSGGYRLNEVTVWTGCLDNCTNRDARRNFRLLATIEVRVYRLYVLYITVFVFSSFFFFRFFSQAARAIVCSRRRSGMYARESTHNC